MGLVGRYHQAEIVYPLCKSTGIKYILDEKIQVGCKQGVFAFLVAKRAVLNYTNSTTRQSPAMLRDGNALRREITNFYYIYYESKMSHFLNQTIINVSDRKIQS